MKTRIAIDPDLYKSGLAKYSDGELVECVSTSIYNLFLYLLNEKNKGQNLEVLLEAGHKIKACWHGGGRGAASNTGKNKAVGIIIEDFLKTKGFTFRLIKPKGYSNFFKDEKFFKLQTGWTKKVNADARAAAAIGFCNK